MNNDCAVIEINCATGDTITRSMTVQELQTREQARMRAEAERAAKEAQDAREAAERTALATWIASHADLPEAARNALARATGVTLPTLPT